MKKFSILDKDDGFSIVSGGPLYNIYLKSYLATPQLNFYKRRIFVLCMLTWLPLLVLATINGVVISGVDVPFIFDLDTHVRFLGSLALLIAAEVIAHQRIREIVLQFLERNIIAPDDKKHFESYIASAIELRSSYLVEISLFILVLLGGHLVWQAYATLNISTWYASMVHGKADLNLAGYWYVFISLPIFQFVLLRWYFRIFVWYRLLWQLSRMPLCLNSLHPDRAGGLSFLAVSISAFAPLILAHTLFIAGMITNRIWHKGASLLDFKPEILVMIGFLTVLVLTPLFFFMIPMARAKRTGTLNYGVLASHYVTLFSAKWLNNSASTKKAVLGADDIQSLADLSNSFEATRDMRIIPFGTYNVLQIVMLAVLPILPLLFTIVSPLDILKVIVKVFV